MEVEHIGPCSVYLGCMRAVLPRLPEKAKLLATDPPYKLTKGGKNTKIMGGKFHHTNYNNNGDFMPVVPWDEMADPCFDACAEAANAYVMANTKNIFSAQPAFLNAGWKYHTLLTWGKGQAPFSMYHMNDREPILFLFKGKARGINNTGTFASYDFPAPRNSVHRTEKPVGLFRRMIENSTDEGELVLDPFLGTGTTLVAAMESGRRGVGVELQREYFDYSCERLTRAWAAIQAGDIDEDGNTVMA